MRLEKAEKIKEKVRINMLEGYEDKIVAFVGYDYKLKEVIKLAGGDEVYDYFEMQKIAREKGGEFELEFDKLDEFYDDLMDNHKDYYGNKPDYDIVFVVLDEDDSEEDEVQLR